MTTDTTDARVVAGFVCSELGLHDRVALLAAKVHRLSVFIAAITAEGAGGHKQKCNRQKDKKRFSRSGVVQVQRGIGSMIAGCRAPTTAALDDSAREDDDQTENKDRRQD